MKVKEAEKEDGKVASKASKLVKIRIKQVDETSPPWRHNGRHSLCSREPHLARQLVSRFVSLIHSHCQRHVYGDFILILATSASRF